MSLEQGLFHIPPGCENSVGSVLFTASPPSFLPPFLLLAADGSEWKEGKEQVAVVKFGLVWDLASILVPSRLLEFGSMQFDCLGGDCQQHAWEGLCYSLQGKRA